MLLSLKLNHFRNISSMELRPDKAVNMIVGENGSGKTSILEAIYLLGLGRSFRSRSLKHLVQHQHSQLQVIARCDNNTPVGLQFHLSNGLQIRLNQTPLKRLSDLATQLPIQYIPANCHQFFELGPKYRRRLIDWGVFHVEPEYNYHWQSYKKSLQQRNAALKNRSKRDELLLWDNYLNRHGMELTEYRSHYLERLRREFKVLFSQLCPAFADAEVTSRFSIGWPKNENLIDVLLANIEKDQQHGYTRYGAHACDWTLKINNADPAELLSRGQQKLFFLAISLAQLKIIHELKKQTGVLLIDDVSSELDQVHQLILLDYIQSSPVQSFITSTNSELKSWVESKDDCKLFHVEQGQLST
ncbi:MAG: DNA replication/repair protein RecF [Methylophaga sp.]|nr:DNA replication/repair protein RecF [Methylophaga sp.]